MGTKTPPYKNDQTITEAFFKGMVVSALRSKSRFWKPALRAKEDACIGRRINRKSGKISKHYKCAVCGRCFPSNEVAIDHIIPVIDPTIGWIGWDVFIDRLFAKQEDYQILCHECHEDKTNKEKKIKKEYGKHSENNKGE